jgi:hypothetical protein
VNDYNFMQLSDSGDGGGYHRLAGSSGGEGNFNFYFHGAQVNHNHGSSLYNGEWNSIVGGVQLVGANWDAVSTTNKDDYTGPYTLSVDPTVVFDRMSIGYEGDNTPGDEMIGSVAHVAFGRGYPSQDQARRIGAGQNPIDVFGSQVEHYWPMTRETIRGHLNFDVVGGKHLRLTQADNPSVTTNLFDFRGSQPCPVRAPAIVVRRPLAIAPGGGAQGVTGNTIPTGLTLYAPTVALATQEVTAETVASTIVLYVPFVSHPGRAWGEQNPTGDGEQPVSWQTWEKSPAVPTDTSGDTDWGLAVIEDGTPILGPVVDMGLSKQRTFTVEKDKYQTGKGTTSIDIRGSATSFAQHDGSPAWGAYSGPQTETWRYVQLRLSRST